ncbi:protein kinase domain-containing protein [Rubrivirga sp. IMCC43871]|uniref:protein kinase domain-containing protein n=1 Tax=Rubrivirga sp. IMCC43871 TaxID=3391575 RepID=UPI00398FEFE3
MAVDYIADYEIEGVIGEGGMGVVYQARHPRLDRAIALKAIAPHLGSDPEASSRFIQEAKIAGSLDHPNVCTIYDVGRDGQGRLYMVMALYRGSTIREMIDQAEIDLPTCIDFAIQIGEGLMRVHEEGIVHRDVKPSNLFVTRRGVVKILDFGVAKLGSVTRAEPDVRPGTVRYMSPEQLRGEGVDERADIWALGVVLYEMAAGRCPFRGEYHQAVVYSILHEAPEPIRSVNAEGTEALDEVLGRFLSKDVEGRFQTMAEAVAALHALRSARRAASGWQAWPWRAGAVLALAVSLLWVAYLASAERPGAALFSPGRTAQLTRGEGLELDPALSPDGKMVAYAAGREGAMRLHVRHIAGGRPIALTEGVPGDHRRPRWAPDGNRIAFQSQGDIYTVPTFGGVPRRLVDATDGGPAGSLAWSPDGRQIAYTVGQRILVRGVDSGAASPIVDGLHEPHSLSWSPDGDRLAYVEGNSGFVVSDPFYGPLGNIAPSSLWVVLVGGGAPVRLTDHDHLDMSPVWAPDGRRLLFVSDRDGSRDVHLLEVGASGEPEGPPVRLTTGLDAHTVHLSSDGARLAYSVFTYRQNMWSVPIPESGPSSVAVAEPVTTGNQIIEGIGVSSDGRWLVFDSNVSGNQDIYKMPLYGGEPEPLTEHPADDFLPSWSPDGQEVAFYSFRQGNRDLYTVSATGRHLRQLTAGPSQERYPDWAPDGRRIVFHSDRSGRQELYTLSWDADLETWGAPRQLTFDGGDQARWSPRGDLIAYIAGLSLRVIEPRGGAPRVLVQTADAAVLPRPRFPEWSEDGRTVYYKAFDAEWKSSIWSVPVTGGEPTLLVRFDDPRRPSYREEFAAGAGRFYFTVTEQESDIWTMDMLGGRD